MNVPFVSVVNNLYSYFVQLSVRQCEGLKEELVELQTLYDSSQRERAGLDQELRCCRAELEELVGRTVKVRGHKGLMGKNINRNRKRKG